MQLISLFNNQLRDFTGHTHVLLEVEHYGVGRLVCVGNVGHKFRGNRNWLKSRGRWHRVIEVDHTELRHNFFVVFCVRVQMIHRYDRQIRKLEVIDISTVTLFYTAVLYSPDRAAVHYGI